MRQLFLVAVLAAALLAGVAAPPAPAVVHEIYSAWCAGKGEIEPPGISDDTKKNFARPVMAGGVVSVHPIPEGPQGPAGILIDFNFDLPQVKIIPTGQIVQIGVTPAGPLYIEDFVLDPAFGAFAHCPKLVF
jgi:hypothetical protein